MFVGKEGRFGIGSGILEAYNEKSFMALGYFVVHIDDLVYGVQQPDASLLAVSMGGVERRLAHRGTHVSPLAEWDAATLSCALHAIYHGVSEENDALAASSPETVATVRGNKIIWAPDGEEAFDDGSYIFQFDRGRHVRLIAFRSAAGRLMIEQGSLRDLTIDADEYYGVLEEWLTRFQAECRALPKSD